MSKSTFGAMAGPKAKGEAPRIGVGMMGYAFMGKAHSNAYKKQPYMMYPPVAIPELVAICGRDEKAVQEAQKRYGYQKHYTDWQKMLDDKEVQLFDNGGPNDTHAEPSIAAAKAGKHVFCEKPLARTARRGQDDAGRGEEGEGQAPGRLQLPLRARDAPGLRADQERQAGADLPLPRGLPAGMDHAAVRRRRCIWRCQKKLSGSGALGDLGAHIIDLARHLIGEIESVSALTRTFIEHRARLDGKGTGKVDVDDAFVSVVEFENGAIGTLEATRFAGGRKNHNRFEINGEKGTIVFDLERLNELEVFWVDEEPKETRGFHRVLVTEGYHPFISNWWPHGHIIGWEHAMIHEMNHLLDCIVNDKDVAPLGADFEDGYRCAVICDAIVESARSEKRMTCKY